MAGETVGETVQKVYFGPSISIHAVTNYKFGVKNSPHIEPSQSQKLINLEKRFNAHGQQRSVAAVLLTHLHGHPHVLLLKTKREHVVDNHSRNRSGSMGSVRGSTRHENYFRLPGGLLEPGESEGEGVQRILFQEVAPNNAVGLRQVQSWEVHSLLSTWWRPKAESYIYPYCPAHITRPIEQCKVFLVVLSEESVLAVGDGCELIAVSLMDLYQSVDEYGSLISSLPTLLSRFTFHCMEKE